MCDVTCPRRTEIGAAIGVYIIRKYICFATARMRILIYDRAHSDIGLKGMVSDCIHTEGSD